MTDQPRITTVPARPGEATIHLPEYTYWDTQACACEIGVPDELLPGLRDALAVHLASPAATCGEECAEGHVYAGRCELAPEQRHSDGPDDTAPDDGLRQQLAAAEAAIARVRALHRHNPNSDTCEPCSDRDYPDYSVPWPCPTIAALDQRDPAEGGR